MSILPDAPARPVRRIARGLALAVACGALGAPLALAEPGPSAAGVTSPARAGQPSRQAHAQRAALPALSAAASTDLAPAQLLAQVNAARARYGVPPLRLDGSVSAALAAHARYAELNATVDADPSSEEQSLPGWTQAGADIAPYATLQESTGWRSALAAWLSDPWFRDVELLDATTTSIGFASSGVVHAYVVTATGEPPTGYPRTYPAGGNEPLLANAAPWLSQDYGCRGKGLPITATWDYAAYGQATATGGSLQADGRPVATCTIPASKLSQAQSAIVPAASLAPGTHYTGTLTATLPVQATGGSRAVQAPVDFTTWAPPTSVAGDQSGDRHADVFVVDAGGSLWLYKADARGVLGHGWRVAGGWGSYTWVSQAGDVDHDGRTDLLGRRANGDMYLFRSLGMGAFAPGVRVGRGWSGLTALTVVGDLDHDGRTDLVGRTASGDLLRYTLGRTITGGERVGWHWNGMDHLVGVGSMNGDAYDDILAVRGDGNLYVYFGGPRGRIVGSRQVGRGWTGWTALFTAGDFDADGRLDLVGRNAAGDLYTYLRVGSAWSAPRRAGSGFAKARLFA